MHGSKKQNFPPLFLKYKGKWLLITWVTMGALVNATSVLMENSRGAGNLEWWMPFCWEFSSSLMILLLIPLIIAVTDKYIEPSSLRNQILLHLIATVPFSIIHVAGMVTIRKACYLINDSHYIFVNSLQGLPYEFLYEYRKDVLTYITILVVIFGYRFVLRRVQGEACYLAPSELEEPCENDKMGESTTNNKEESEHPERLLVKKLGKEFLIQVRDLEWVEACGNYANLHIKDRTYPMRITMAKLEKLLPPQEFIRIHRSHIVNLSQIREVQALETGDFEVTLNNGKDLNLSRRYREKFKAVVSFH